MKPPPEFSPHDPAPDGMPALLRTQRWLAPLLVAHAGLFLALATPHGNLPWVWAVSLAPMFIALDLVLGAWRGGARGFWLRVLGCTWPVGVVFAAVTGGWVVNTAHVYGGMPAGLAHLANLLGYGAFFGLECFAYLGAPFALTRRRPWLALVVVPLWATVLQLYVPRFLFYTYGQAMATSLPLVQAADVLGSGGLNLLFLPLQLLLCFWARALHRPGEPSLRGLAIASAGLAAVFVAAFAYGSWQLARWEARQAAGARVELVGIQPNFSLRHLASNPALSPSRRRTSLEALLTDSSTALERARREPGVPVLTVWPESVYPRAYFFDQDMRQEVEDWVRRSRTDLVLASQDFIVETRGGRARVQKAFGVSLHLDDAGRPVGVYRKIALIPYGETIPLGDWFPFYRRWLRAWIPQISEFTKGTEYTVFRLSNGVKVAPMICFDAADETVARGMARNGARLGLVLANLAWFGRTSVSDQFAVYVRFRAIENRMPILLLSQNGESFLIGAGGRDLSPRLEQFASGALVETVGVPEGGAAYTAWGSWINAGYALLLAAALAWGWRSGAFSGGSDSGEAA